jgi:HEAT repeat protein
MEHLGWFQDDGESRIAVVQALGEVDHSRSPAEETVSGLANALTDPEPRVRMVAIIALSKLRLADDTHRLIYLRAVRDPDHDVQTLAMARVCHAAPRARWAALSLIDLVSSTNDAIRERAVISLRMLDRTAIHQAVDPGAKPMLGWLADLRSHDVATRIRAIFALGQLDNSAIIGLEETSRDDDPIMRRATMIPLAWIGEPAIATVRARLDDPDQEVRREAILALARIGRDAVPTLVLAIQGEDEFVQDIATSALGRIGPAAFESMPTLIEALGSRYANVRESAASSLGAIGADPQSCVAALSSALENPAPDVRCAAIRSLSSFGTEALPAFGALLRCLKYEDDDTRFHAMGFLYELVLSTEKTRLSGIIPALIELMTDESAGVRDVVFSFLLMLGPSTVVPIQSLIDALADPNQSVRTDAAVMLGHHQSEAAPAVRALVEILESPSVDASAGLLIAAASSTLGKIGPRASAAIPALRRMMSNQDPSLQFQAASALVKIDPDDHSPLRILIQALGSRGAEDRCWIAQALGRYGPNAQSAIPALIELSSDESPAVRRDAEVAIARILAARTR